MLKQIGTQAKDAAAEIAVLSTDKKNQILQTMADELLKNSKKILDANKIDLKILIFPGRVFEACNKDLASMGIMVISYTVKEVHDDVGYLTSLGQSRTAEIHRDARVGEAKAQMESQVAEAKAEEQRLESRLKNDTKLKKNRKSPNASNCF